MTYIFMAVHYPAPGKLDEVYAGMRRMADSATARLALSRSARGPRSPGHE
jgi:hypothetical protein